MPKREVILFDAEAIRSQLQSYDRSPFIDVLALYLECMPTVEALVDFADANPDKWASAIASIGKLAGFTEKKEVAVDINLNIKSMSDSQLEDRLNELLKVSSRDEDMKTIEHDPSEVRAQQTQNERSE